MYIHSLLNTLKNSHRVYMMYTTKPYLSRKLRREKTHYHITRGSKKVFLKEAGMDVSNNQE